MMPICVIARSPIRSPVRHDLTKGNGERASDATVSSVGLSVARLAYVERGRVYDLASVIEKVDFL